MQIEKQFYACECLFNHILLSIRMTYTDACMTIRIGILTLLLAKRSVLTNCVVKL